MTNDQHKNYRDEQFWFTAATVGFNGLFLTQAEVPALCAVIIVAIVSLFGSYLVLSRWIAAAGRQPDSPPDAKKDSWFKRLRYTGREIYTVFTAVPYVLAELSGSFFYLLIILMSLVGVIWKHWHGLLCTG